MELIALLISKLFEVVAREWKNHWLRFVIAWILMGVAVALPMYCHYKPIADDHANYGEYVGKYEVAIGSHRQVSDDLMLYFSNRLVQGLRGGKSESVFPEFCFGNAAKIAWLDEPKSNFQVGQLFQLTENHSMYSIRYQGLKVDAIDTSATFEVFRKNVVGQVEP